MFKDIKPEEFRLSPFQAIGKDWMLVAAEKDGKVNAMTAAWGGLGVMWEKNVAFAVLRPQRFTRECVDAADVFSLNFFDASYKEMFGYMGSVSGRDEDKIAKAGLTVGRESGAPLFEEARTVVVCRKLYRQQYDEACFVVPDIAKKWYPKSDYHFMYIGEILRIMGRE